jgi:hypothetical protein
MGADLWCHNIVELPANIQASEVYTLYWVWDWPTATGTTGLLLGKDEVYTTCIDIDIIDT